MDFCPLCFCPSPRCCSASVSPCWSERPADCCLASEPCVCVLLTRSGGSEMAIPVVYNLRSVKARWTSAIVAVVGIAGTVGVFFAMLSLARGFRATLVSSGSEDNAIIMRAGATSEMTGGVGIDTVKILQDAPGIARGADGPLVTAEVVVGKNANVSYAGLTVGNTISLGNLKWNVVGVFDAGGSAFDSEVWCDGHLLGPAYNRPDTFFQSVTAHLTSPGALQQLKDATTSDPRLNVDVSREIDYYSKQSTRLTTLITVLGGLVAGIMAIGAVFGALNTMYSAVSERGREIATIRALGFGGPSVVFSFVIEALLISFVGGLIGCVAVLPLNGWTTGAMNLQTFSHMAFAFKITGELLVKGVIFALIMGVVGGLFPAIRAASLPISSALREL